MTQCVCGQYAQPGDVQCRYCGRPLEVYSAQGAYDAYNAAPPFDPYVQEAPFVPMPKQQPYPQAFPQGDVRSQGAPPIPPAPAAQAAPKPARAPVQESAELRQFMMEMRMMMQGIKRNTMVMLIVLIVFAVVSIGVSFFSLSIFNQFLDWMRNNIA